MQRQQGHDRPGDDDWDGSHRLARRRCRAVRHDRSLGHHLRLHQRRRHHPRAGRSERRDADVGRWLAPDGPHHHQRQARRAWGGVRRTDERLDVVRPGGWGAGARGCRDVWERIVTGARHLGWNGDRHSNEHRAARGRRARGRRVRRGKPPRLGDRLRRRRYRSLRLRRRSGGRRDPWSGCSRARRRRQQRPCGRTGRALCDRGRRRRRRRLGGGSHRRLGRQGRRRLRPRLLRAQRGLADAGSVGGRRSRCGDRARQRGVDRRRNLDPRSLRGSTPGSRLGRGRGRRLGGDDPERVPGPQRCGVSLVPRPARGDAGDHPGGLELVPGKRYRVLRGCGRGGAALRRRCISLGSRAFDHERAVRDGGICVRASGWRDLVERRLRSDRHGGLQPPACESTVRGDRWTRRDHGRCRRSDRVRDHGRHDRARRRSSCALPGSSCSAATRTRPTARSMASCSTRWKPARKSSSFPSEPWSGRSVRITCLAESAGVPLSRSYSKST